MILADLFEKIPVLDTRGSMRSDVTGIEMDSRLVKPGDLFVAVKGTQADGHTFIPKALELGAKALLVSEELTIDLPEGVTVVRVADTEDAVG